MVVEAHCDQETLLLAFSELLEEGYTQSRLGNTLEFSSDEGRERIFGSMPRRSLSPGYYELALYLLWLEGMVESGAGGHTAFEMRGLATLKLARQAFARSHPPCGECGAHQDNAFSTSCHHCGVNFLRKRD